MLGIAIRSIQHSQAMLERGVCELAHFLSFLLKSTFINMLGLLNAKTTRYHLNALNLKIQSPTQSCRSLSSPYNSADLSGFLNKLERIENGLSKRFFIEMDVHKRRFCSPRATLL